eukprot:CAMPEP_0177753016 /NCGR_PEP_ID=MMETSP0491_2-20121128/1226_1 /TAXON_ID=63592 /ORGANISM="Tetraselmis chuii, Strain PLY429" /LENGTH=72 /DNA_ID=CAMNT_0019268255 /DNA_START=1 /DNA_END=219 /DNA_ORIENTATION=-
MPPSARPHAVSREMKGTGRSCRACIKRNATRENDDENVPINMSHSPRSDKSTNAATASSPPSNSPFMIRFSM